MTDTPSLLALAEETARIAGNRLHSGSADLRAVDVATRRDVKIRADRESEKLVRAHLSAHSALPIIGEEEGGDASLIDRDEAYWVVDPLDGTYNYLRGLPHYCVSIGVLRGLEPVLGVIFDFERGEMFSAIPSNGLLLNGEPAEPEWAPTREEATCTTGFPAEFDFSDAGLRTFITHVQVYKKIRMMGSAALSMAYVACGRYDAYYEHGVKLWDIAGGMALVQAAGGVIKVATLSAGKLTFSIEAAGSKALLPDSGFHR